MAFGFPLSYTLYFLSVVLLMSIFSRVNKFLQEYCLSDAPLLLALSGGPDSLCLFYCLLAYREQHGRPFHIAHVDHGWRSESQEEAQILQELAHQYQIPFHLKTLNPNEFKGNLEAACRKERYLFFASLYQQIAFQGVITGHQQDDQAETIFKRVLEGSHWSHWTGLKPETWLYGVRILRPLLEVSKKEIQEMLAQKEKAGFEDSTNRHLHFLRARLRETIFPRLNQEFGKQVQKSFIEIGQEARELVQYFENRLVSRLDSMSQGPWGTYLDLQAHLPENLIEIKYLLRLLCSKLEFFLSREIIEQASIALQMGKANQLFVMGRRQIWIDRKRIFILHSPLSTQEDCQKINIGTCVLGNWVLKVEEVAYPASHQTMSWKEGWQGKVRSYLPVGSYTLGFISQFKEKSADLISIKKRWNQSKVPAFLPAYFPIIWTETEICHEFLTGRSLFSLKEGMLCWKIDLELAPKFKSENFKQS